MHIPVSLPSITDFNSFATPRVSVSLGSLFAIILILAVVVNILFRLHRHIHSVAIFQNPRQLFTLIQCITIAMIQCTKTVYSMQISYPGTPKDSTQGPGITPSLSFFVPSCRILPSSAMQHFFPSFFSHVS